MSFVDNLIADVTKAEAGASSVETFIENLYSEVKQIEGSVMPLFDELLAKKSAVAAATAASSGPTGGGGQAAS